MPTREQVRELLDGGLDYEAAGQRLGIPPGQAYMIATGVPADGSDTVPDREMAEGPELRPASQHLANPPHENPTGKESVRAWMSRRAAADGRCALPAACTPRSRPSPRTPTTRMTR